MNILLVDDEVESRRSVAEFLRELGHIVEESSDGQNALNKYTSGEFDLVLSDIMMPVMTGIELLRRIREMPRGDNVRIVLFTGCSNPQMDIDALKSGANGYFLKPINIEDLVRLTELVPSYTISQKKNER